MRDDPNDEIVAPPIDMQAVIEAADVYLSDPTTRTHQIGLFALDLAAVVAANDETCRLLADLQLSHLEKRKAVATALLIELLGNRPLHQ
ncbi:MAG: hypothetical protein K2X43_09970 [Hyphomonadaceae bacterium]|nr:hypothetical protein [Hyphomonadaceae bacterium]